MTLPYLIMASYGSVYGLKAVLLHLMPNGFEKPTAYTSRFLVDLWNLFNDHN